MLTPIWRRGFLDLTLVWGGECADEVCWVFMLWANENYGERYRPAPEGLREAIQSKFGC